MTTPEGFRPDQEHVEEAVRRIFEIQDKILGARRATPEQALQFSRMYVQAQLEYDLRVLEKFPEITQTPNIFRVALERSIRAYSESLSAADQGDHSSLRALIRRTGNTLRNSGTDPRAIRNNALGKKFQHFSIIMPSVKKPRR